MKRLLKDTLARRGMSLLAFLPQVPGRVFGEVDTLHSFSYRQELTHTALRVQESGADAEFLAFLPRRRIFSRFSLPLVSRRMEVSDGLRLVYEAKLARGSCFWRWVSGNRKGYEGLR
jgi:hypothetical protein